MLQTDLTTKTSHEASATGKMVVLMKGYPRLSETFIAQELLGLQEMGFDFDIWALRHPTDKKVHDLNKRITAKALYLPEYLYRGPIRVAGAFLHWVGKPSFKTVWAAFWQDFKRDMSVDRIRRFGQGLVLAREISADTKLIYVHFLHTPASVARYAAILRGIEWTFSAHAKDIWTTRDWEKREKIADCAFGVTCTASGHAHLQSLAVSPEKVARVYHGLNLERFPAPIEKSADADGTSTERAVKIVSVGRLVAKKGFPTLLDALTKLPPACHWEFHHVGGGALKDTLEKQAAEHGLTGRITWHGAQDHAVVIDLIQKADLFVLPSRIAEDGDRDGLPNVLMEAASQKCPIVTTKLVSIMEFIEDDTLGYLAEMNDADDLATQLQAAIADPKGRLQKADRLYTRLVDTFSFHGGLKTLAGLLAKVNK